MYLIAVFLKDWTMIVVLFFSVIILLILYSWILVIKDSNKLNVCGPFPLPLVGNGHLFLGDSTKLLTVLGRLAKEYNDAFRFYVLSHRYVAISHPKYIEPFLSSSDNIYKGRAYNFARPWLGEGVLTSSGLSWKKQRKFLAPAFHFSILQTFLPVFWKNNKLFITKLMNVANGSPVNVPDLINSVTFDNIMESVMGISFNKQKDSETEYSIAINEVTKVIAMRIRNPILANNFLFSLSPQKDLMYKAIETIHTYSKKVIKARRQELMDFDASIINKDSEIGTKNKLTFLDQLLLADIDGEKLDDKDILAQVSTFMFAGYDTVATTLTFVLYCISKEKEVQEKLFEEQKEIFKDNIERDPTYNDIQQMKYMDLVLKESMRLFPAAPVLERLIVEDTYLSGLYLPKNTLVFVNIFEMHRNPRVFKDPKQFRPERFENNLEYPCSWIPFSAGPRNCIGLKYAMLEMKVILSSIVRHFQLLPSGREPELCGDLVMKSKNGVYVGLLPRF